MKKHIILFIAIFFASVLHAQTINIRGTVTDTSNETLPGVSITIKGTQTGTVSDANGNYSIRAQRGNVLEFTFVGMVKQSVTVGKQNVINIQMAADAINLDEVVAIGYGIAKKSDLTGAVASIKSENLTNCPARTCRRRASHYRLRKTGWRCFCRYSWSRFAPSRQRAVIHRRRYSRTRRFAGFIFR